MYKGQPTCRACPMAKWPKNESINLAQKTMGQCMESPPRVSLIPGRDGAPVGISFSPEVEFTDWCAKHPEFKEWMRKEILKKEGID